MADLKNLNLDAFAQSVDRMSAGARQDFVAKLEALLKDTLAGVDALRFIPGRTEDLFIKSLVACSREAVFSHGPEDAKRPVEFFGTPSVRIDTSGGCFSFAMADDYQFQQRKFPPGRYRILLFMLPVDESSK